MDKQLKLWYLYCLSEELGEVIQAIGKGRRYGWANIGPTEQVSNLQQLKMEIHDCIAVYELISNKTLVMPERYYAWTQLETIAKDYSVALTISNMVYSVSGILELIESSLALLRSKDEVSLELKDLLDSRIDTLMVFWITLALLVCGDDGKAVCLKDPELIATKKENLAKWLNYKANNNTQP